MSERSHHRRPSTVRLDDPGVVVMDPDDASRPSRGTVQVTPEIDPALLPVPLEAPMTAWSRSCPAGALSAPAANQRLPVGMLGRSCCLSGAAMAKSQKEPN